jgi:hypothetical protein
MNIYEQFLDHVRNKTYPEGTLKEFHHEPPHHTNLSSDDSPFNVSASVEDHILLHQYRWIAYGEKGDYLMFKGRQNDTQEFRRVMNERRIEVTRGRGNGFWDPQLQSVLGKRGGSKGGSANTEKQFIARQKVGQTHGKSVGMSRQDPCTKRTLSHWTIWVHEETGKHLVAPHETVTDLQETLTSLGNRLVKCNIASVIKGSKRKLHGWSLQFVYTAISSQATDASVEGSETSR